MAEREEEVKVVDRRGRMEENEDGEGQAQSPAPPLPHSPAHPPGVPVRLVCTQCGQDYSEQCMVIQLGPQVAFAMPLICPHCKQSTAWQQRVSRVMPGRIA